MPSLISKKRSPVQKVYPLKLFLAFVFPMNRVSFFGFGPYLKGYQFSFASYLNRVREYPPRGIVSTGCTPEVLPRMGFVPSKI